MGKGRGKKGREREKGTERGENRKGRGRENEKGKNEEIRNKLKNGMVGKKLS